MILLFNQVHEAFMHVNLAFQQMDNFLFVPFFRKYQKEFILYTGT